MLIKCYLFTGMAKQENHTYYSLGENRNSRFYYNFIDYFNDNESFRFTPFAYEIELDSEDVFHASYYYLKATKFKVVRLVEFREVVKDLNLSSKTRKEINSILSGKVNSEEIVQQYKRTFLKEYADLSEVERYKFLAILSQKDYELPSITFSRYENLYYVRLLEFYNRPHTTTLTKGRLTSLERYNREILYGSRDFESFTDGAISDFIKFYDYTTLTLFQTRRLSQEKFEEYCEYMLEEKGRIPHADECVGAGYKILPKYKEHFYPYTIYSNPELALDLVPNDVTVRSYTSLLLLRAGYKIKNLDYGIDRDCVLVQKSKKLFMKNDYKYI